LARALKGTYRVYGSYDEIFVIIEVKVFERKRRLDG
jgi:hypothetical protein